MTDEAVRGRRQVVWIIKGVIGVSLSVMILYYLTLGTGRLSVQLVRLGITGLLCWYLYQGHSAARWIAVVLFGVGGGLMVPALFSLPAGSSFWVLFALYAGIYLTSAAALLFSRSIRAFFGWRRTE